MRINVKNLRAIDDATLDPYQFRVLMHVIRVGECWEGLRTTAKKCGMSLGKASQVRQWLIDNGWLRWTKTKDGKLALVGCSPDEQFGCNRSPDERERSPDEQPVFPLPHKKRSPHEHKLSIPNEEEELSKYFQKLSGILPSLGRYQDDWEVPLAAYLERAGSLEGAKGLIERGIQVARASPNGKRYTIASPRSLSVIISNLDDEEQKVIKVGAI